MPSALQALEVVPARSPATNIPFHVVRRAYVGGDDAVTEIAIPVLRLTQTVCLLGTDPAASNTPAIHPTPTDIVCVGANMVADSIAVDGPTDVVVPAEDP